MSRPSGPRSRFSSSGFRPNWRATLPASIPPPWLRSSPVWRASSGSRPPAAPAGTAWRRTSQSPPPWHPRNGSAWRGPAARPPGFRAALGSWPSPLPGHVQGERRARAQLAVDRDAPLQHAREAPADGEPEARSAVLAGDGVVGLPEVLEDLALVRLRDREELNLGKRHLDVARDDETLVEDAVEHVHQAARLIPPQLKFSSHQKQLVERPLPGRARGPPDDQAAGQAHQFAGEQSGRVFTSSPCAPRAFSTSSPGTPYATHATTGPELNAARRTGRRTGEQALAGRQPDGPVQELRGAAGPGAS